MLTIDGDLYTLGSGEQGQLGRVPELFANRGGRQGLGRCLFVCLFFIYVCARSSLLHVLFSIVTSGGYSLVVVLNFSLQWLLLLRSTGLRAHRLQ